MFLNVNVKNYLEPRNNFTPFDHVFYLCRFKFFFKSCWRNENQKSDIYFFPLLSLLDYKKKNGNIF